MWSLTVTVTQTAEAIVPDYGFKDQHCVCVSGGGVCLAVKAAREKSGDQSNHIKKCACAEDVGDPM
ncbi:hypothetical protein Hanom_Chr06g00533311 [Helianthus anomalus]